VSARRISAPLTCTRPEPDSNTTTSYHYDLTLDGTGELTTGEGGGEWEEARGGGYAACTTGEGTRYTTEWDIRVVRDTPAPARQLDGTYIAVGPALTDGGEHWTEKTQIGVPPSDLAEAILDMVGRSNRQHRIRTQCNPGDPLICVVNTQGGPATPAQPTSDTIELEHWVTVVIYFQPSPQLMDPETTTQDEPVRDASETPFQRLAKTRLPDGWTMNVRVSSPRPRECKTYTI